MSKMHPDEFAIDLPLVQRLLANQFPQWATLPLKPVLSHGTDNALYRLGSEILVRLPRIHWAVGQVEKEQTWLPKLAPHLPITIPTPLAMGSPTEEYPWHWSLYQWLEGENPTAENVPDFNQFARDLAGFLKALQKIDTTGGPTPGEHNSGRGVPLQARDQVVRKALEALTGQIDTELATQIWEEALQAPVWGEPPVWIQGDLQAGNLLVGEGRLSSVIDFGCLGVGDPACDLIVAWNLLPAESRAVFRDVLGVEEATWTRGRGWALSVALIALPYYLHTSPTIVRASRHTLQAVFSEYQTCHQASS